MGLDHLSQPQYSSKILTPASRNEQELAAWISWLCETSPTKTYHEGYGSCTGICPGSGPKPTSEI
jgi:hypothetical protein